ncbi:MAG: NTPase [Thermoplasmata archaeon]
MPRRLSAPVKIGIAGLPGSGKTQTLLRIIQLLEEEGIVVGGMVTEPIIEKRRPVGFHLVHWATKERGVFAHENLKSRHRSGRYGIAVEVLEDLGVRALADARESADVIVIDEVGKLEVDSEIFTQAVVATLETPKTTLMTLHKKSRNPLLQDIRRRDELRLLEVTPVNKNLLPFKVVRLIQGTAH